MSDNTPAEQKEIEVSKKRYIDACAALESLKKKVVGFWGQKQGEALIADIVSDPSMFANDERPIVQQIANVSVEIRKQKELYDATKEHVAEKHIELADIKHLIEESEHRITVEMRNDTFTFNCLFCRYNMPLKYMGEQCHGRVGRFKPLLYEWSCCQSKDPAAPACQKRGVHVLHDE